MAELESRGGLQNAGGSGLERQTVIALARRLKPDDTLDFDRAVAELRNAVTTALDVITKGERGTNQGEFIDDVLGRIAEQTKVGRFDQAAKEIDLALTELDHRESEQHEEMRQSRVTLLRAGIEQDILRRDAKSAAQRVAHIVELEYPDNPDACFAALRERQDDFLIEGRDKGIHFSLEIAIAVARRNVDGARNADQRGRALHDLGIALGTLGERESGSLRLQESIAAFREALSQYSRERAPLDWARTQLNLGESLRRLGVRDTAKIEEAITAFREALKEYSRDRTPQEWAMTQHNIGIAASMLGERESGTAHIEEAIVAYREALKERTRARVPLDWAMTQNNLGAALSMLGDRESNTAPIEEAIVAYREALKERTRERLPLDWASTQHNLGGALVALANQESGTARLEEAVAAFREALKERTRERVPFQWAMTQNNLGSALASLSERGRGAAHLDEAVAAYQEALKERNRERAPLQWGATIGNHGVALMHLADRRNDASIAATAVSQIEQGLEVTRDGGHLARAAYFEARLAEARALCVRLNNP